MIQVRNSLDGALSQFRGSPPGPSRCPCHFRCFRAPLLRRCAARLASTGSYNTQSKTPPDMRRPEGSTWPIRLGELPGRAGQGGWYLIHGSPYRPGDRRWPPGNYRAAPAEVRYHRPVNCGVDGVGAVVVGCGDSAVAATTEQGPHPHPPRWIPDTVGGDSVSTFHPSAVRFRRLARFGATRACCICLLRHPAHPPELWCQFIGPSFLERQSRMRRGVCYSNTISISPRIPRLCGTSSASFKAPPDGAALVFGFAL